MLGVLEADKVANEGFQEGQMTSDQSMEAIETLLRGAHNHALNKAAMAACEALGKCMKHETLTTSHHPDCTAIREAILKERR